MRPAQGRDIRDRRAMKPLSTLALPAPCLRLSPHCTLSSQAVTAQGPQSRMQGWSTEVFFHRRNHPFRRPICVRAHKSAQIYNPTIERPNFTPPKKIACHNFFIPKYLHYFLPAPMPTRMQGSLLPRPSHNPARYSYDHFLYLGNAVQCAYHPVQSPQKPAPYLGNSVRRPHQPVRSPYDIVLYPCDPVCPFAEPTGYTARRTRHVSTFPPPCFAR